MPRNKEIMLRYDLRMEAEQSDTAEIMIFGAIKEYSWGEDDPDVTAKDFDKMLKEAKDRGAKTLNLRINSGGGSVWQAVAMRNMLMLSDFETISVMVEGLCASAATLLCCIPGAKVSIAEGSEFMIHNPSCLVIGTAADMDKCSERLHKMEAEFHRVYAGRCGKDEDEIKNMMDAETWMTAREAVDNGFCDELISDYTMSAVASADTIVTMRGMYQHMPDSIQAEKPIDSNATPEASAGEASVITDSEEEENRMEIRDITMEQLQAENNALFASIMAAGAVAERERINEIDDLTPAGYETMAQEAKQNGMTAAAFLKSIVKAQREKGQNFMAARAEETAPAANVTGGAAEDDTNDQSAIDAVAKEIAEFAKGMRAGNESMF